MIVVVNAFEPISVGFAVGQIKMSLGILFSACAMNTPIAALLVGLTRLQIQTAFFWNSAQAGEEFQEPGCWHDHVGISEWRRTGGTSR